MHSATHILLRSAGRFMFNNYHICGDPGKVYYVFNNKHVFTLNTRTGTTVHAFTYTYTCSFIIQLLNVCMCILYTCSSYTFPTVHRILVGINTIQTSNYKVLHNTVYIKNCMHCTSRNTGPYIVTYSCRYAWFYVFVVCFWLCM